MTNPLPSPAGIPSPSKPGFFKRFVESFRLARDLGRMEKQAVKDRPQLLVSRMTEYADVFLGETGWLTGNLPLTPRQNEGSPPRKFQYPPGYNIQITPRSSEAISFASLRGLGEYTITRIIIERLKEGLKAHEWDIVADEDAKKKNYSSDISVVKKFFEYPDQRHAWDEWLGLIVEEVLVPDALSIYLHRTKGGKLWALEIIDGGTIKVLADERGFEPLPPAPAYQQFLYGVPFANFSRDEMLYRPRNRRTNHFYGFSPIEQLIVIINMGLRRELYDLSQFTEGNIPAAFVAMPSDWKAEEIKSFQEYFDAVLSGDAQNRSKLRFLPGGTGTGVTKFMDEPFELFNKFDEWIARVSCYAFGMSPTSFITMTNRAVSQEMGDVEAEQGFASIKLFVERLINEIIDGPLAMPHLRFNWITDRGRLQAKRVAANVEYVKSGIKGIDEIRAEEGLEPYGIGPGIVTATGFVALPVKANENIMLPVGPTNGPASEHDEHAEHHDEEVPSTVEERPRAGGGDSRAGDPRGQLAGVERPSRMKIAFLKCRDEELAKWERYCLTRLEKGAALAGFNPDFIGEREHAEINTSLMKAKFPDEVRHIFSSRRAKMPHLKLDGPRSGDAAHHATEVKKDLRAILEAEARRIARR